MKTEGISRRGFLRVAAAVGAAFAIEPTLNKVQAAEQLISGKHIVKNPDMQYRTLGSGPAAFEVSALGFGVMGMTYNRSQYPDKKMRQRVIAEAVDHGVTLFDTAIIYGPLNNEEFTGEALAPYKNRVNITTKFGHEVIDGKATGRQDSRPETIRRYCEGSLRRLGIDSIPMFYQHRFDPNTPIEEVAGCIGDLIKEGKVQRWGLCEVSSETIRKAHAVTPVTAIQSEYHLMHRLVEENGVLDTCRELGWLLHKAPWIVPIPGTTKISHLEENLHTFAFVLADSEWSELERRVAAIPVVGDRYNAEQQKQVGH